MVARPPVSPLEISARLAALSRRLGSDIFLTQGASGNTAVKLSSSAMIIKASRTRLIDMTESRGWARVDLGRFRQKLDGGRDGNTSEKAYLDALDAAGETPGVRVSLETGLHAQLPAPWTAHVHSLAGQLLGRLPEAEIHRRTAFLNGVAVRVLPAVPPGLALTTAAREALRRHPIDGARCLCVMRRHGLLWGGPSDGEILALSDLFEQTLRRDFGLEAFPPPAAKDITPRGEGWFQIRFEHWPRAALTEEPQFFEFADHFRAGVNLRGVSARAAEVRAETASALETHRQVLFAQALLASAAEPTDARP